MLFQKGTVSQNINHQYFYCISLFIVISVNTVASVKLSLYYESLCPHSIDFITKQLYPTYQQLDFDVEFVPYGFASHSTNPWSIKCQHGPDECLGNAVQACAIARYNQKDQVNFINCVMSSGHPPTAGQQCAEAYGLNYEGVAACSTGNEGRHLLAAYGDITNSLNPPLNFVPNIRFNDMYSVSMDTQASYNLRQAICQLDPLTKGC